MTAPVALAIGDTALFATSCRITMQSYGLAPHRADVAQLVTPCTVIAVHESKNAWPLTIELSDGSRLVATANELTMVVAAERGAMAESEDSQNAQNAECDKHGPLARAVAA